MGIKKKRNDNHALNFFAEAGLLKKIKRSGWWVAGIKDPESVAEHCFRCALIGYYIAHLEGVDPYKVVLMTLFNDILVFFASRFQAFQRPQVIHQNTSSTIHIPPKPTRKFHH